MKRCFKCKHTKNLDLFYKSKRNRDGLQDACKECCSNYGKIWHKKNKPTRNKRAREIYYEDPGRACRRTKKWASKNKDRTRLAAKRYMKKNPELSRIYAAVHYNVKAGKLKKTNCQLCGNSKVQAHHEDYSKPLKVIWLCRKCHKFIHRRYNADTASSL